MRQRRPNRTFAVSAAGPYVEEVTHGWQAGKLEGKVAFITGAARGQGRAHPLRLAGEGADILALDLAGPLPGVPYESATPDDLAETAREVEALDRRIVTHRGDVRDLDDMKAFVDAGVAEASRGREVGAGLTVTVRLEVQPGQRGPRRTRSPAAGTVRG